MIIIWLTNLAELFEYWICIVARTIINCYQEPLEVSNNKGIWLVPQKLLHEIEHRLSLRVFLIQSTNSSYSPLNSERPDEHVFPFIHTGINYFK